METSDRQRIEIAFEGPLVLSVLVTTAVADDLDRALAGGGDTTFAFDADDGRYTLLLRRVVYVKRFARESRVGFGSNG